MDWIKRNLYFLVVGVVALALMGMAGYFFYSKWQLNNEEMTKLNGDYDELRRLNSEVPHPGAGQVNNVKVAQEQREAVRALITKARQKFEPVPRIPDMPKVTERDFSAALSRTLEQLQRTATNSGVQLPANYLFSFSAQNRRVSFASGSLDRLAIQLGEVKTMCDVLFRAKVNTLDNIRRERVSTDDNSGQLTDYFDKKSQTNDLAVLSPYEVSFRCFSGDLANALAGFASSPYGMIVKAINVETAPAAATEETPTVETPRYVITQPQQTQQSAGQDAAAAAAFRRRYGMGPRGGPPTSQPTPQQPQIVYATPQPGAQKSNQPALDERQLKVTLNIDFVKLINKDAAKEAAPDANAAAAAQPDANAAPAQ